VQHNDPAHCVSLGQDPPGFAPQQSSSAAMQVPPQQRLPDGQYPAPQQVALAGAQLAPQHFCDPEQQLPPHGFLHEGGVPPPPAHQSAAFWAAALHDPHDAQAILAPSEVSYHAEQEEEPVVAQARICRPLEHLDQGLQVAASAPAAPRSNISARAPPHQPEVRRPAIVHLSLSHGHLRV